MAENLPTKKTSATLALEKAKSRIGIANKLLGKNGDNTIDDDWVDNLYKWADENNLSVVKFPRNKKELLELKNLSISFVEQGVGYGHLPKEIENLTQLEDLCLHDVDELPDSIINLKNIKSLYLAWGSCEYQGGNIDLISTWIKELERKGCDVFVECDVH